MLHFENLSVAKRISHISGQAEAGDFVHIMGTNGAGKSTLLHIFAGILSLDSGQITWNNQALSTYSLPQLATFRCLQEQHITTQFSLTVSEALLFSSGRSDIPSVIEKAFEITNFLKRPFNQLSGGEAKRVQIARSLLQIWPLIEQGKALILLDEPNQGLDFKHQHLVFQFLHSLCQLGNVVIVNHHDLNLCQQYANKVWLLKEGQLRETLNSLDELALDELGAIFGCTIQLAVSAKGNNVLQTFLE